MEQGTRAITPQISVQRPQYIEWNKKKLVTMMNYQKLYFTVKR